MPTNDDRLAMSLLFSYGTLQRESVQRATFGRTLTGQPDAIVGFMLGLFTVTDPVFVAEAGGRARDRPIHRP